jgi:oligoribonuclease
MPLFTLTLTRAANTLRSFRNMSTNPLQGRLTYYDGPLVWIDCEMTGLDYKKDRILEIAVTIMGQTCPSGSNLLATQVLITNGNLEIVDEGLEFIIRTDKSVLDKFDSFLQIKIMMQNMLRR